jgi:hypothetical protein
MVSPIFAHTAPSSLRTHPSARWSAKRSQYVPPHRSHDHLRHTHGRERREACPCSGPAAAAAAGAQAKRATGNSEVADLLASINLGEDGGFTDDVAVEALVKYLAPMLERVEGGAKGEGPATVVIELLAIPSQLASLKATATPLDVILGACSQILYHGVTASKLGMSSRQFRHNPVTDIRRVSWEGDGVEEELQRMRAGVGEYVPSPRPRSIQSALSELRRYFATASTHGDAGAEIFEVALLEELTSTAKHKKKNALAAVRSADEAGMTDAFLRARASAIDAIGRDAEKLPGNDLAGEKAGSFARLVGLNARQLTAALSLYAGTKKGAPGVLDLVAVGEDPWANRAMTMARKALLTARPGRPC